LVISSSVEEYLNSLGVSYKALSVDGPTVTAQDAATQLHVPIQTIIKTIVFVDQNSSPVLAILTGDKRVDKRKLSSIIGVPKVKIASPEVTKSLTGFEVGVMPPVGHKNRMTTVIDRNVMDVERVYGGCGVPKILVEIDPRDIARLMDAKIADICE
jgi:Cys-tRNA(Pro) deacylase